MQLTESLVSQADGRRSLELVLASEAFARSQRLSALLKYLCSRSLENGNEHVSEYIIGTEVLGRPADFDPTEDAGVRVEMHRLRRRLRQYYDTEGSQDKIRVCIPPGRYLPMFETATEDENAAATLEPPRLETLQLPVPEGLADPPVEIPRAPEESAPRKYRWMLSLLILMAVTAVGAAVTLRRTPAKSSQALVPAAVAQVFTPDPAKSRALFAGGVPQPVAVRIGAGRTRSWTDRLGHVWNADSDFKGGKSFETGRKGYIARAADPGLFDVARIGEFEYAVPLASKTYELRLYFVEPVFGPQMEAGGEGNRLFDVSINDNLVLERFDILSDAGGPWIADVRVFKDITPGADGLVHLKFHSRKEQALLSAMEFVPAQPHRLNPIRILPQDNFYMDSAGNLWNPESYVNGGHNSFHPSPMPDVRDLELFRHERFGHFDYALPVDRGSYSMTLYMAEKYYGTGNPGGGGPGTRVFDVFCNGIALIRSIDLYKEAGANHAVIRTFHHLTPNAQGKLNLSFVPISDYASVYALEVLDESAGQSY